MLHSIILLYSKMLLLIFHRLNQTFVRPLRGRSYHHSLNRRLRCLRQLNQRLWIFAAFGDALASDKVERGDARLR